MPEAASWGEGRQPPALSSERLGDRADLGSGSGKPCLFLSPGFSKAGLYPSQVEKGFMEVGCLLSDRAPQDHAHALGAKTMKGTLKFSFGHFSATPEEMGGVLLVLWGTWDLVGSRFHLI